MPPGSSPVYRRGHRTALAGFLVEMAVTDAPAGAAGKPLGSECSSSALRHALRARSQHDEPLSPATGFARAEEL